MNEPTSRFLDVSERSVLWLKEQLDQDALILRPRYQRNPVWLDPQKASLIDSILRGYPIPELYLQFSTDEAGTLTWSVVDGQQRIRACLEYLEDGFSLDAQETPDYGDATFSELNEPTQERILSYVFVVRELPNVPEDQVREIFKRLNQNVLALNRQELRHATYSGPFIQTVEALAEDEFWLQSGVFSANDYRRMLDAEFLSELVVAFLNGPQNKKETLDRWYTIYEQEFEARGQVEEVFRAVTGELAQVLPDMRRTRWRNKSDCYSLFLAFASHLESIPLSEENRTAARDRLLEFGELVTASVSRSRETPDPLPDEVRRYGDAVQRAASDVANRIERREVISQVLNDLWR